jgi:hypothetical protein
MEEGFWTCPGMGQIWGPVWGSENDPFWVISTYKEFVNTPAILFRFHVLGVSRYSQSDLQI